jgi:tripartite-type tricarboxylate transporter receptor subunit TctC
MALRLVSCLIACVLAPLAVASAHAQDFFKGKQIGLYVGYEAGGGYDVFARTIARHIASHIAGTPSVIVINMPGASSMVLGNHLAKVSPRDGTAFGAVNSALLFDTIFAGPESKAQFRGTDMTMIGNIVSSASVLIAWKTTGIKTLEDLKTKPLIIAATSRTGDTYLLPLAIKKILGLTNMKIIMGYSGTAAAAVALERGEVTGRVWDMEGIKAARPQWLTDGSINILAQLAPQKMPEVPASVPLVKDSVPSEEDRKVLDVIFLSTVLARPYIGPPGIPAPRAKVLRDAFMATMRDPAFLAETDKLKLTVDPMSGEEMQKVLKDAYALPEETLLKVRKTLSD